MVTMVLLNVAWMWTTPTGTTRFPSASRTRPSTPWRSSRGRWTSWPEAGRERERLRLEVVSELPRVRLASAGSSGARTQGGGNSSAIAPTEDAASAQIRRRQACAGGFETASKAESAGSSSASRRRFGIAPITRLASAPSRNRIRVGIERTSKRAAVCWFSSILMLTMREVLPLGRHLLEDRVHDAAGTAPGRPEVHQHRLLGLEHLRLEVAIGHVGKLSSHFCSPDRSICIVFAAAPLTSPLLYKR